MVAYTFYETDNRVRRYAETLAKRGDEVDAFVLRRPGQPASEVISGVNVHRIQNRVRDERTPYSYLAKLILFFIRSALILTFRHLRRRYKIIHVHSVPDFQVFATLIPWLSGAKVILDIHDIIPEFYASKFRVSEESVIFRTLLLIEKLSARYAHHVIIANHLWHGKLIGRSVPSSKCTAIINYPDPYIFHTRPRKPPGGEFLLCYPGTLNWHQGVDIAIQAVKIARIEEPGIKFLIIGDGAEREKLRDTIRQQHLEDYIILAEPVPLEQIAERMAAVDLGVVPKRKNSFGNEAFSTKIMEFMAVGVPVLASDTRIDRYYFTDRLLRFFPSGSVEQLAANIIELARDPGQLERLRTQGLQFIEHNNWEVRKHEYLNLVDSLISAKSSTA